MPTIRCGRADAGDDDEQLALEGEEVGTIFDNKTFSYRSLFEQAKHGKLSGRFGFEGFNRDYEVNKTQHQQLPQLLPGGPDRQRG